MKQAKYQIISHFLKEQIQQGLLKGRIPSEVELAKIFKVSRMTARKGISQLIFEDLLYQVPRSGTFVVDTTKKIEVHLEESFAFKKQQSNLKSVVTDFQIIPTDLHHQKTFNLKPQDTLYAFSRARYKNNSVFAYEFGLIPTKFLSLSPSILEGSLTEYFEQCKLHIQKIQKEYKALIPNTEIAEIFQSNTAIFSTEFYRYIDTGELLEHITVYYNQNQCTFIQTIEKPL